MSITVVSQSVEHNLIRSGGRTGDSLGAPSQLSGVVYCPRGKVNIDGAKSVPLDRASVWVPHVWLQNFGAAAPPPRFANSKTSALSEIAARQTVPE